MTDISKIIDHRIAMDTATLNKLKEAGDDEQLVRYIDHSFTSSNQDNLAALAVELQKMQFGHVSLHQPEDSYYLLECSSLDCTEFHSIVKASVLLEILAREFNVEYDGWGCSVANEER